MGCWFDDKADLVSIDNGRSLGCRLILQPPGIFYNFSSIYLNKFQSSAYVELVNFRGLPAGKRIRVLVGRVRTPPSIISGQKRSAYDMGVFIYDTHPDTHELTYTHYGQD